MTKFNPDIDAAIDAVVTAHTRIVVDQLMVGTKEIRELCDQIAIVSLKRTDVELAWWKVEEAYRAYRIACDASPTDALRQIAP